MKNNLKIPGETILWIDRTNHTLKTFLDFLVGGYTGVGFINWEGYVQLKVLVNAVKHHNLKVALYAENFPIDYKQFDYIRLPSKVYRIDYLPEKAFIVDVTDTL